MEERSISDHAPAAVIPRRAIGAVLLLLLPFASHADDSERCTPLNALVAQAASATEDPHALSALSDQLKAEQCGTALSETAAREIHCRWSFDYRSDESVEMQDRMASDIRDCLHASTISPEQGVNHPDTYDQQLYRAGDMALSVSLKDKAALQRSFVFLRIEKILQ